MAIRNILKKVGDKARLVALVGGLGIAGAAGCAPEGTKVKRDADGIVDATEMKERVEAASDIETPVSDNNEVFLGLLNDDSVAIEKRMNERGLDWDGFGDLYVHTSDDLDGLKGRYKYCTGRDMPGNNAAFYCDQNNTAYLVKSPLVFLVNIFYHEFGHHLNSDFNATGHIVEIPAEAMRIYSSIFRRAQDMATGTMFGRFTFTDNIPQDVPINSSDDISRYSIGVMAFFMEANNQCGDLDRAVSSIMDAGKGKLNRIIGDGIERNAGFNAREMLFNEIDDLLNNPGFVHYLQTLGMKRAEKRTEAQELVGYLKIMAKDAIIENKNIFLQDSSKEVQERLWLFEDYVQDGMDSQFFNPNFKNRAVSELTQHYNSEVIRLIQENTPESWQDALYMSEKIIKMNEGYPCDYDTFACNAPVSKHRPEHLDAYVYNISARFVAGQSDETLAVADSFLDKFYPGKNYAYDQNDPVLASRMIKIVEKAYLYSRALAYDSEMNNDIDSYKSYMCRALDYLRILNEATCYNVGDETLRDKCYNDSGIGAAENSYLVGLPHMEEGFGDICE